MTSLALVIADVPGSTGELPPVASLGPEGPQVKIPVVTVTHDVGEWLKLGRRTATISLYRPSFQVP